MRAANRGVVTSLVLEALLDEKMKLLGGPGAPADDREIVQTEQIDRLSATINGRDLVVKEAFFHFLQIVAPDEIEGFLLFLDCLKSGRPQQRIRNVSGRQGFNRNV